MIISDMTDFIKVTTCSETTHVSTKQRRAVIFASFNYFSKKNSTKVHKIWFFFNISCLSCISCLSSHLGDLISRKSVNDTNLDIAQ